MTAAAHNLDPVIDAIPNRRVPGLVVGGGIGAMVIGLAGFGFGLATMPEWAWGAVLVGIVYTLGIAQGGVMFSVVATLTWARWSQPLKRIAESFAFFLPVVWLALLVFLLFGIGLYPWNPDTFVDGGPVALAPHSEAVRWHSKEWWLTPGFFMVRQLIGVAFMIALDFLYIRASLRPDLIKARARLGEKAPKWWDRIIGRHSGDLKGAVEDGQNAQSNIGPLIAVTYALVMSLVAFDLIMSLAPWWYSNMFGGWFFSNSYWLSMQCIGLFALIGRDWLGLGGWVRTKTTHDLGKLILAFTMAWAYMLFAQILPIWYANMPEETDFLLIRLSLPQWSWLSQTVAVMCFVMPFTVLVSRGIKKMRYPFAALLACMMFGVFLERTTLVMPSVYKGDEFPWLQFVVVSGGVWIGFMGAFVTVVTQVLSRLPPLPISDPKLDAHPWDVHVHSEDVTHSGVHVEAHTGG